MAKRRGGLPPQGKGIADWYIAREETTYVCPVCRQTHRERPAVLEYRGEIDHGGAQRRKHPGWDVTGWLVMWEGPGAGLLSAPCFAYVVVSAAQVAEWGKTLGGWESL